MRTYIYILIVFLLVTCNNHKSKPIDIPNKKVAKQVDSILTFSYTLNIHDSNIINTSDRRIDLLYNGVEGFLNGKEVRGVRFHYEWIVVAPIQKYKNGLLFIKRLFITPNKIIFYKKDLNIGDSVDWIKDINYYRIEKKIIKFRFEGGNGIIRYVSQSCNDADFTNVQLYYNKGIIEIKNIINVTFFEYDLDNDGQNEQYLLGRRSCSQELVILRIIKTNSK